MIASAIFGSDSSTFRNFARGIISTRTSLTAVTVAERGSPSMHCHLPEEVPRLERDRATGHLDARSAVEDDVERIRRLAHAHQGGAGRKALGRGGSRDPAQVAAGQRREQRHLREQVGRLAAEPACARRGRVEASERRRRPQPSVRSDHAIGCE